MTEVKSYLKQRVYEQMSLTEEQCSLILKSTYCPKGSMHQIFTSDKDDNIDILVYNIRRQIIEYEPDKEDLTKTQLSNGYDVENMLRQYKVKRYNPEWLKSHPGYPKYKFPGGSTKKGTYPFLPPKIIEKYESAINGDMEKGHIDTLVLTEGYFKAMCASVHGIDIIGLGSVTLFADSKTKRLYEDIVTIINTCKPNNIVILYDGDCTDISKNDIEVLKKGKVVELSKRPQGFLNVLKKLRDLLLDFKNSKGELCELFFLYVAKMREINPPKGLDDLYCDEEYKSRADEITKDLNSPGTPSVFFERLNLRTKANQMAKTFHLNTPEEFYTHWNEIIGLSEFGYRGGRYKYSSEQKMLMPTLSESLKDYICVNNSFYKRLKIPSVYNEEGTYDIIQKDKGIINGLHGKDSTQQIINSKYYEDFANIPSHTDYQQEIIIDGKKFYNLYKELNYTPSEGDWSHIRSCLVHLFGDNTNDYKMALDYIQLMYINPTQKLPVLALVSEEHGTGKTAFLNLISHIFEDNAILGDNELLLSQFNSNLAGKIAVGIDETELEGNGEVATKIKRLVTSEYLLMEMKGKDKVKVANFMKLIMTSNHPEKFVYPDKDENRYWIVKVKSLSDEEKKINVNSYFAEETPHFVWYLLHREMFVKEYEDRLWFAPIRYFNENWQRMIERNMPKTEKIIRNYLKELFLDTRRIMLKLDIRYFKENIEDFRNKDESNIRDIIEYNLKTEKQNKSERVKMPFYSRELGNDGEICWSSAGRQCRPYIFYASNYLTNEEMNNQKEMKDIEKEKQDKDTQMQIEMNQQEQDDKIIDNNNNAPF